MSELTKLPAPVYLIDRDAFVPQAIKTSHQLHRRSEYHTNGIKALLIDRYGFGNGYQPCGNLNDYFDVRPIMSNDVTHAPFGITNRQAIPSAYLDNFSIEPYQDLFYLLPESTLGKALAKFPSVVELGKVIQAYEQVQGELDAVMQQAKATFNTRATPRKDGTRKPPLIQTQLVQGGVFISFGDSLIARAETFKVIQGMDYVEYKKYVTLLGMPDENTITDPKVKDKLIKSKNVLIDSMINVQQHTHPQEKYFNASDL